ncbi:MAG: hypothetical protein ACYDER_01205 [Ktedonobacteraceae bacterium]
MLQLPDDYADQVEYRRPNPHTSLSPLKKKPANRHLLAWSIGMLCVFLLFFAFVKFVWPIIFGVCCLIAALWLVVKVLSKD